MGDLSTMFAHVFLGGLLVAIVADVVLRFAEARRRAAERLAPRTGPEARLDEAERWARVRELAGDLPPDADLESVRDALRAGSLEAVEAALRERR